MNVVEYLFIKYFSTNLREFLFCLLKNEPSVFCVECVTVS